ncbi:hypothetical protein MP228_004981 [Amoeboaphelidium protococcarum]|nr:hypothetical protein MP228_005748 [Amoeboaphelidium protococcarum]KAI3650162.1 hypothetical protein MP228_004981 [Amoeboaphelidium protococcarum]
MINMPIGNIVQEPEKLENEKRLAGWIQKLILGGIVASLIISVIAQGFLSESFVNGSVESLQIQQLKNDSLKELFNVTSLDLRLSDDLLDVPALSEDDENFTNQEHLENPNKPARIYIYDIPEEVFRCQSQGSHIEDVFMNELFSYPHRVWSLDEADIAVIPIRFFSWYYTEKKLKAPEEYAARNELFRQEWDKVKGMFKDTRRVPHIGLWSYVFYRTDVSCIDENIILMANELYGVTGEPEDALYENGCFGRCIPVPYSTIHSFDMDFSGYFPHTPVDDSTLTAYEERRLLTFIGSTDRTPSLTRYRSKVKQYLSKKYSKELYTGDPQINTASNSLRYRESKFCVQLNGDTPTRNGFYESILEGCTPIIYERALQTYRELLGRSLPIDKVVLTLPDTLWQRDDADFSIIDKKLEEYTALEATRQRLMFMKEIAPYLIYGKKGSKMWSRPFKRVIDHITSHVPSYQASDLVYVYDLPTKFNKNILRRRNKVVNMQRIESMAKERLNGATELQSLALSQAGNLVEILSHFKLMQSAHLTVNYQRASLAVIPIYLHLSANRQGQSTYDSEYQRYLLIEVLSLYRESRLDIPHFVIFGGDQHLKEQLVSLSNGISLPRNFIVMTVNDLFQSQLKAAEVLRNIIQT